MNHLKIKRVTAAILLSALYISASFAQTSSNDGLDFNLLKGGISDGKKIVSAYVSPWTTAFAASLNSGWYNTAKPHKLGGFDITATVSVALVPASATSFDLKRIGLDQVRPANASASTIAPTIAGSKNEGPDMVLQQVVNGTNVIVASFRTPKGTGFNFMGAPMAQIGIGLPLGTEIKLRYLPDIKIGTHGDISLIGAGIMHSIIQYFPGHKLLPFDLSVFAGYTKLQLNVPVSMQPDNYNNFSTYTASSFTDQKISTTVQAFNANIIGSVKLAIFTFYGGVGYIKTNTKVDFKGKYPFPGVNSSTAQVEYTDSNVKTVGSMDLKGFSGMRANIGFTIKLAVVTLNADVSRAQYNTATVGLGFSFR